MAKNQHWNNKIVLVTGGSSGIGLAAAKILAAAGAPYSRPDGRFGDSQ